jgi:hypothetical protein
MDDRVRTVGFHSEEGCSERSACGRRRKSPETVAEAIGGIYWRQTGVPRGIQAVSSDDDARLRKSLRT